ncbi:hypothetical protein D9M69_507390 [compost metagenome]
MVLPKILFEHSIDQTIAFAQGQHRVIGLIDHRVSDAGHRPEQHALRLPGQVEALCQSGLIGQVDLDFVRVAATTGDIGTGNVVDLFQPRRAFGQGHQFLLQLHWVGGIRVGLVGEHINAHVIEQRRTGVGAIHRRDGHGEQLLPQRRVDVDGIEHAPDTLHQLIPGRAGVLEVAAQAGIEQYVQEALCLGLIGQLRPEIGTVDAPTGYVAPVFRAVVRVDHPLGQTVGGHDGFRGQLHRTTDCLIATLVGFRQIADIQPGTRHDPCLR